MHKEELIKQFTNYQNVKDSCSSSGDWTKYADLFREKNSFVDHHGMGRFENKVKRIYIYNKYNKELIFFV